METKAEEFVEFTDKIFQLSKNMKVFQLGAKISKAEDPWKNITGRFKIGRNIDVEDILKNKGFENVDRAEF